MACVAKILEDQAVIVEETINKLCHRIVKDLKTLKGTNILIIYPNLQYVLLLLGTLKLVIQLT